MFSILVGLIIVAFLAITSKSTTYGSKLEEYINSKNPTNIADIEKYEREFQEKNSRSVL